MKFPSHRLVEMEEPAWEPGSRWRRVPSWIMTMAWEPAPGLGATPGGVVLGPATAEGPRRAALDAVDGLALSEEAIRPALKRAQLGERRAFGELFQHFDADVARLCRRLLGDLSAAEDAKSEVFLRAQRSFASYDPGRPFRRWLLSIAGHHCTDQLRRRQTEARIFHPGELEREELSSTSPSPLRQLLEAEQRDRLLAGIEALPPKYRLPLVLRYQAELDYAAIAEILEVPRERVGTLLFRAKARLRRELADAAGGGSDR